MFRKLTLAALAAFTLGLVTIGLGAHPASAEVAENGRVVVLNFVIDNPCEDGYNPMTLTGWFHGLWYTTPEGGTMMRATGHYKGTDADGNEYVANTRRVMEHFIWPSYAPFTDLIVIDLVSKGGDPDARFEMTIEYSADPLDPFADPSLWTAACCG